MTHNIYLYIFVMAAVTYLIRMLPLALSKKEITNQYIKSFLYYVPYACLAAMTFPAILYSPASTCRAYHRHYRRLQRKKLAYCSFSGMYCSISCRAYFTVS